MNEQLRIGMVAKRAGVNLQTVMYYERRGLLSPDSRTPAGYRLYSQETVDRIRFVKNAQSLGFTLKEAGGLLRLSIRKKSGCGKIKIKAAKKLADVQDKISGLQALEKSLKRLVGACRKGMTTGECPILESLDANEQ